MTNILTINISWTYGESIIGGALSCISFSNATSNVSLTLVSIGGDGGRSWWLGKGIDVDAMMVVVMGETSGLCVATRVVKYVGVKGDEAPQVVLMMKVTWGIQQDAHTMSESCQWTSFPYNMGQTTYNFFIYFN